MRPHFEMLTTALRRDPKRALHEIRAGFKFRRGDDEMVKG